MNPDSEVIYQCFEELAEAEVDIASKVYADFSANMPQANQHIDVLDERMRGRMLDQIYRLLMGDAEKEYLEFETRMHKGYGATGAMYRGIFEAVKNAVSESLGESWSQAREAAWDRSIDDILSAINTMDAPPPG